MAVQGPIARTVHDLRLALKAMSGYDPRDSVAVPGDPAAGAARRPLKVGVVAADGIRHAAPAVDSALQAAAGWLAGAGYEVEEVRLPLLELPPLVAPRLGGLPAPHAASRAGRRPWDEGRGGVLLRGRLGVVG